MTVDLTEVLKERGSRHGIFTEHAAVTQELKAVIARNNHGNLSPDQQESLDMICHKIGRVLAGDPNFDDHWIDIAGYAKLVADRLSQEQ